MIANNAKPKHLLCAVKLICILSACSRLKGSSYYLNKVLISMIFKYIFVDSLALGGAFNILIDALEVSKQGGSSQDFTQNQFISEITYY